MKRVKKPKPPKPGIRIDGGRRRDLNGSRVAGRMAGIVKVPRSKEEIAAAATAKRKVTEADQRKVASLIRDDGGKDGAQLIEVEVKISRRRIAHLTVRCRTGTFEWRYGRKQSALFHAGNHFAILWERAGVAVASSADFLRGTTSGYPTGVSDGRVAAIDALRGAVEKLGHFTFERLMMYCVQGMTASEIAMRERCSCREIGTVLNNDLRQCAIHFKFLGNSTGRIRSTAEMT
jgi:hypothetical protein